MRRSLVCMLTLLVCATAGCGLFHRAAWKQDPPAPNEAAVVQPGKLHTAVFDNGLRVIVLEDRRLPKLSFGVSVRRGAGIEDLKSAGIAQYTADMMERGAGKRDALALARAIDEIGGSLSVSAGWDGFDVGVSGLSSDRERLQEILLDVVLRPRFEAAEGQRARKEQLAVLQQALDDPATLVRWYAAETLYPEHRYGKPQLGSAESVGKLNAGKARRFHARLFVPNNAILYAVGDLDPVAWIEELRPLVEGKRWPRGDTLEAAAPPPDTTPRERRVVIVDRPDLVQTRIMILHEGIERTDDRRLAANLMNNVLGGSGFSSRLMSRVRSDEGLTYGVYSGFSLRRRPGPFQISTFTRVSETRRTIDLLLEEMRAMLEARPVDVAELKHAKSYSVGRFGLGLETSAAVLSSLVELDVHGLPEDSLDTFRARIRAISLDAVNEAALQLLHPERAAIVVLGPAEDLVPALEGLGPIEVIQP